MTIQERPSRLPLSFPVLVELEGELKRCMADNVSSQGMLFLAVRPYRVGEHLIITFLLPATDLEIEAEAEVIHVTWDSAARGGGIFKVGVRFDRFSHDASHPPLHCLPC